METRKVSLVNNSGCRIQDELTEEEIQNLLNKGWKISKLNYDDYHGKTVVANLVRFGV